VNFLSVCSGIDAASVAWNPLGWKCVGLSEIDPFPCSVLRHRFHDVQNFGDMNGFEEWNINGTVDILVG
jgi:DNA (cytosine-5)-methyltransferase 1